MTKGKGGRRRGCPSRAPLSCPSPGWTSSLWNRLSPTGKSLTFPVDAVSVCQTIYQFSRLSSTLPHDPSTFQQTDYYHLLLVHSLPLPTSHVESTLDRTYSPCHQRPTPPLRLRSSPTPISSSHRRPPLLPRTLPSLRLPVVLPHPSPTSGVLTSSVPPTRRTSGEQRTTPPTRPSRTSGEAQRVSRDRNCLDGDGVHLRRQVSSGEGRRERG